MVRATLKRCGELLISPSTNSTVLLSWWTHRRTEKFKSVHLVSMCWGARERRSGMRKGGRVESKTTASSVSSGNADWRTERKWWWWCMCAIGKWGKKSEHSPEHAEAALSSSHCTVKTQQKRKAVFYSTRSKMIFDHCESFMKLGASLHLIEAAIGFASVQAIMFRISQQFYEWNLDVICSLSPYSQHRGHAWIILSFRWMICHRMTKSLKLS